MGIENLDAIKTEAQPIHEGHGWPTDDTCLFGSWMSQTGPPKATQYRTCVHPKCKNWQTRDTPKA